MNDVDEEQEVKADLRRKYGEDQMRIAINLDNATSPWKRRKLVKFLMDHGIKVDYDHWTGELVLSD